MDWESTPYSNWYRSHRRFSFTAHYCIALYEDRKAIPDAIFKPFLKALACHSKGEEKLFPPGPDKERLLDDHSMIVPSKSYSTHEKYEFCKSLLVHMKQEEQILSASIGS